MPLCNKAAAQRQKTQQGLPDYFARQPFFVRLGAQWISTGLHQPALLKSIHALRKYSCKKAMRDFKQIAHGFLHMVELMGVEPMSEKGSKRVSPGAGSRFDFPYSSDECQTELFGSFMGS